MRKLIENIEKLKNLIEEQRDDFNIFKDSIQYLYE